jgi:tetratricopeptide (TPR) repeat protein
MKTRITLILAIFFLSSNISFAQQDEECVLNLQLFSDFVKSERFDDAYEPWMALRNKCPKFNRAIYQYGEKILKHKIKNSTGTEKVAFINDLMTLWDGGTEYFVKYYPAGKIAGQKAQLMYDYRKDLGMNNQELYDAFDNAFKAHNKSFTHPKWLYTYFSLIVDLFDVEKKSAQEMFDKYDDVSDKIETEVENHSKALNTLVEKEDKGETLTKKEGKYKKSHESYLSNYALISESMDKKLGDRANCEVLIPLYKKDFEEYKNDAVWLKRSVNKMYNKGCTEDPLYIELVKAYDETSPSADTKYFVATILFSQGKDKEAFSYLKESYDLEQDPIKKGKRANKIGSILKKKGQYGQARGYFRNALRLNPSNGRPHLYIAAMYNASAKNCGDTNFNKRAVFWLAASEARKAGRVDPTLRKAAKQSADSYSAKAPSRTDIFNCDCTGKVIKIGCWIQTSVTVPKL